MFDSPIVKYISIIALREALPVTDIKLVVCEQSTGAEGVRAVVACHDVGCGCGGVERVDRFVRYIGFDVDYPRQPLASTQGSYGVLKVQP